MTGIVDWAAERARMIIVFIAMSLAVGWIAYTGLPKEGEPDIDVPVLVVTAPLPGVSAEDSETLLVQPLENELRDIDGLAEMTATAAEGVGIVVLEFEFGWDKSATIADVRDRVDQAQAEMPAEAEEPTISEINFSEFPILVISLSGNVPERTLLRVANDLQTDIESMPSVLEAGLAGHRDEMLEVTIDPLRLEAYNVTAQELLAAVQNNNQLVAAGEVENGTSATSVKIPSSFDDPQDVYNLPVKVNGDRVITLGDLAEIRLTFEDAQGTARYNGETTVALQVVKRKGVNLIDTVADVRAQVAAAVAEWPPELQDAITVNFSMDESTNVADMVSQLEASVLTAIALVMVVMLLALGVRSSLLVGFAIPTSFLLCFALLSLLGFTVSNIVMFGLILAVGMLVDGAIVVVEYADKRIERGEAPMQAYAGSAKRMFWPIISSTATTLCAFLPMLFWPGIPGEFMGMLPVTLIFVLSASLVVALVYLPVVGGVSGRVTRMLENASAAMRRSLHWSIRAFAFAAIGVGMVGTFWTMLQTAEGKLPLVLALVALFVALSVTAGSLKSVGEGKKVKSGYRKSGFGWLTQVISGNIGRPYLAFMPFVVIGAVVGTVFWVFTVFFPNNNYGVEFFVEQEPERAVAYVRARGNLSLEEKDRLVQQVEEVIMGTDGVESIFAFAGSGGLNQNTGGASAPNDAIGQVQIELLPWNTRRDGNVILDEINENLAQIPGVIAEISESAQGPAQGKPLHLRLTGSNWEDLLATTALMRARFDETPGLVEQEDNRPLPGIDWQINVDVEAAGRYGADVATVGGMVQLVTRGILLDTMRVDSSDEEIEIRVRFPEEDRILATLDTLRVRTQDGLVPMSNFVTREPVPSLAEIGRVDSVRYFDVKSDVAAGMITVTDPANDGEIVEIVSAEVAEANADAYAEAGYMTAPLNANERIAVLTEWLETEADIPAGIEWEWTGDQEEQAESQAFLMSAFAGALGLMFVILLAQFNSFYNSVVVLLAVVLSVAGALVGMVVMQQPFSIIMTGTGIVALAGIVVNNNIVLIDTYQEYARYMPKLEAISRTAQDRLRPVLLTTITTIAGLLPMALGVSLNFAEAGTANAISVDAPTALWWKQLATAVVFGLAFATILTLVFTPAMLAARVWVVLFAKALFRFAYAQLRSRNATINRDRALGRAARRARKPGEIDWTDTEVWNDDISDPWASPKRQKEAEPPLPFPASITAAE
ncbi:efflux RND transporter permease subunit [Pontivivens insulae]|uniref:Multidrug export protein AcrF n=1 Tax=Pontivivens insulae TaxID=1639689 RepID=A0A2R8ABB2_9RHOB|nr:efflux RND transporter permease subunit [Pontivivens insulae]RED11311.1 multidrug efflux pump [Pontivivens insulae]SPF29516.1 Multidrug export protein AcrF [Pontivivens insulae]